ncbi:TRAP transporter small permease [Desulfoscipio geothermicus]|uniref:C4-dicarboxylate transporter, DctQ subunit n=1 Tax=Desulfoscipio geothermicus DSM 3669 TaxID=1121426 RepID=A0A1I6DKZ7_9FIRM|nr:TRAP transporter small permease [Desulfoscipio geothermicus]SFR06153.1 C4-dicarboxylate transporter, DctQ subunit [Desulfoscipio geothermicus DSM 3669]
MTVINTFLNRLEEILVSAALTLGSILTFVEVILRYGFGASLGITQELVIYLLIFTGLIGASIGVREKTHIGVDIIVQYFPCALQKIIVVTGLLTSALFCLIFAVLGFQHAQIMVQLGQVTPEMEIPFYIPKSIVPVAFGLMTLRFLQETIKNIKVPAEEIFSREEGVQQ